LLALSGDGEAVDVELAKTLAGAPMMEERPPGLTCAPGRRFENWVTSRCWLPVIMTGNEV